MTGCHDQLPCQGNPAVRLKSHAESAIAPAVAQALRDFGGRRPEVQRIPFPKDRSNSRNSRASPAASRARVTVVEVFSVFERCRDLVIGVDGSGSAIYTNPALRSAVGEPRTWDECIPLEFQEH